MRHCRTPSDWHSDYVATDSMWFVNTGYQNFHDLVFRWLCAFLPVSQLHRVHVMKLDFLTSLYMGWSGLLCYKDCLRLALRHCQWMGYHFCESGRFLTLEFALITRIRAPHPPTFTGLFIHECCFCHYSLRKGSAADWKCWEILMKIVRASVAEMTLQAGPTECSSMKTSWTDFAFESNNQGDD